MGPRTGIRSLEKGLAALEALAQSPTALPASALADTLKLARPTVYRILASLLRHGYVTRDRERARYRLSFKLLDIGHRVLKSTDLLQAARPALQALQESYRETVHLAVPEAGRMVYLDKLEGTGPFCMHSRIGTSVPMHCTALGKAVLAFLSPPEAKAIVVEHGLPRRTPRTIVTWPALERDLARVRRRGYALDDVETEEDVRCVGAPIFDYRGRPVAALSVSAPTSRMPMARVHGIGPVIRKTASAVSQAMGWAPAQLRG
jgi:IclR family acetate operon transcriptional repressor